MADQVVQEIRDRLDIVDLVGSYVALKKAGTNFKGLCPFHHEKSGSFIVSPSKQIYHCFGCGAGGDAFEFIKNIENVDFRGALKLLADRVGVKLPEYSKESSEKEQYRDKLLRINAFAAQFYNKYLNSAKGKKALEYVKRRGLTKDTIEKWSIGFAPEDFHALDSVLLKKDLRALDLVNAGVSVKNDKGTFDRFRNRVTFPIYNYMNECVGFTARILVDAPDQAKYINSPETDVYNKSKVLFGLNFAKSDIRKKDYVVVVEGQMDCIKAQQEGFLNVVATSGTALTEEHIKMLKRLTKNVIFIFDSDDAGKKALMRAAELAMPEGMNVKVTNLGEAKDPDELISKDPQLFARALKNSIWFIEYLSEIAQKDYEENSIEQKRYVSTEIMSFVNRLTEAVEREHYIRTLSERFDISEKILTGKVTLNAKKVEALKEIEKPVVNKDEALEKEIMGASILLPKFLEKVLPDIKPEEFNIPETKEFFTRLKMGKTSREELQDLLETPLAREAVFMVESKLQDEQQTEDAVLVELTRSYYIFRLSSIKNTLTQLAAAMKRAQSTHNGELLEKLTIEYKQALDTRRRYEQFL